MRVKQCVLSRLVRRTGLTGKSTFKVVLGCTRYDNFVYNSNMSMLGFLRPLSR